MNHVSQANIEKALLSKEIDALSNNTHNPINSSKYTPVLQNIIQDSSGLLRRLQEEQKQSSINMARLEIYESLHGIAVQIHSHIPWVAICDNDTKIMLNRCHLIVEKTRLMIELRVGFLLLMEDEYSALNWHMKKMSSDISDVHRTIEISNRINKSPENKRAKNRIDFLIKEISLSPCFSTIKKNEWLNIKSGISPEIEDLCHIRLESGILIETKKNIDAYITANYSNFPVFSYQSSRPSHHKQDLTTNDMVAYCQEYTVSMLSKSMNELKSFFDA